MTGLCLRHGLGEEIESSYSQVSGLDLAVRYGPASDPSYVEL